MNKKVLALFLTLAMVLSSVSVAMAKPFDIHHISDPAKVYSFNDFSSKPSVFTEVLNNASDYLLEAMNGKLYRVVEVDAALNAGAKDFSEAIKGLTPVEKLVPGELKVVSVSAIDHQTVEVVFSEEVDKESAETIANYVLSKQVTPPVAPVYPSSAALEADNKTVTLTFASNTLAPNTTYNLYISNIRKMNDLDVVLPTVEKQIVISDEAPVVVSARVIGTSSGNTTIDLTFNQEVVSVGTVSDYVAKTAGETDKTATEAELQPDNKTVRLTFPALTDDKEYTIELPDNIQNRFGKPIAADATVTVTTVADTTAPTVVSVMQDAEETDADNQVLKVKFSEPITGDSLTGEVFASDLSYVAVSLGALDGDTVTVFVPNTFELKAGQTYTLKITDSDITDMSGNPLAVPIIKTFTAIDKLAPVAQKVTKVDEKTVKIEFNETVYIEEGTTFTVDGVDATASASGNTITLTTTDSFGTNDVTALVINGAVKDAAGNETAYTNTDIMSLGIESVDAAAPVVVSTTASSNTITLTFSEDLATISDIDTPEKVAEVLTITKADGTAVTASALVSNGPDLEITVSAVNSGDVFYVKFKSGQTVVADSDNNKYTNTKSIKVVAP